MAASMESLDHRSPEDPDQESFWHDFLRVVDNVLFSEGLPAALKSPAADAAIEAATEVVAPPLDTALGIGQVLMGEVLDDPRDALASAEADDSLTHRATKAASGILALAA